MARIHHHLLVAILPLGLSPLFACENDENAGALAAPDGGALELDSSAPALDSAAPPPPVTSVTVTVLGNDGPRSGVLVVFHDANGAVLETKTTAADGKATSTGATPAMASALLSHSGQRDIVTWTELEAGDELAVNDFDFFTDRGGYEVSLPALFDGAAYYDARVGDCASGTPRWTGTEAKSVPLRTGCVRAQNGVLVDAFDENDNVIAHAFAKNVALPGATPLAVPVGNFVAPTDIVVAETNIPAEASNYAEVTQIVGGVGYETFGGASDGFPKTFQTATGFADAVQAVVYTSEAGGAARVLGRRVAPPVAPGTFSFDFATALPLITGGMTDVTDPRRPLMTWTSTSSLSAADGGFVQFMQYLGGDTQLTWTFVIPSGVTSMKAPSLPADADAWLPGAETEGPGSLNIVYTESDQIPNYATFRRQQGTLFRSSAYVYIPTLQVDGTINITMWRNDG